MGQAHFVGSEARSRAGEFDSRRLRHFDSAGFAGLSQCKQPAPAESKRGERAVAASRTTQEATRIVRWPQLFAKQSIRLKPGVVGAAPTASAMHRWRNGNATVRKTVTSRFDPDTVLQRLAGVVQEQNASFVMRRRRGGTALRPHTGIVSAVARLTVNQ